MLSNMKRLGTFFMIIFFVGIVVSAYSLYRFPEAVMQLSPEIDLKVIAQIQPILIQNCLMLGITALLGLATVTFLVNSNHTDRSSNLQGKQESIQEETQETYTNHDDNHQQIDQEAIEAILASGEELKVSFDQALSVVCKAIEACQAAAYITCQEGEKRWIELFSAYAYHVPEGEKVSFRFGEGLAGQVAKEGKMVNIDKVPEGYVRILSGLGSASPRHLIIIPLKESDQVIGVVEIASFHHFSNQLEAELLQTFDKLALKLVNDDNVSLEKAKH